MLNSFSINIDGQEYQAVGDEAKINESAKLLNEVVIEFNTLNRNAGLTSLERTIYAALNLADMKITNEQHHAAQLNEITTEIQNITTYIKKILVD